MRLTAIIILAASLHVSANSFSQKITISSPKITEEKAFTRIKEQTGFSFLWNEKDFDKSRIISIDVKDASLSRVLDICLKGLPLTYSIKEQEKVVFITPLQTSIAIPLETDTAHQPLVEIHGLVTDSLGAPLWGASVSEKRRKKSVVTDEKGYFSLDGIPANSILLISYTGYQAREFTIPGNRFLEAHLSLSQSSLDELQVIAYGTTTKRLNTADISTVKAADIENQPIGNPMAALEGRVPGMLITQSNGVPGSSFTVQIRGQNSLAQGSDPLFVVDGVPFAPNNTSMSQLYSSVGTAGLSPLNSISPSDIESIEVLKDADATSIYGSRGANGVILITTKKGKTGRTAFTTNVYSGASVITHTIDMMNTQQYLAERREALQNDGVTPTIDNAPELLAFDTTLYTNFKKVFLGGTARTTDAQISLTGGGNGTSFLIGSDYHDESTIYPGGLKDRRASFHSNVSHVSANKKLTANLSTTYVVDDNHLAQYNFASDLRTVPNTPPLYDSTGKVLWELNGVSLDNPMLYILDSYNSSTSNLLSSLQLSYQLLPGLTLKSNLGYNMVRLDETNLEPIEAQDPVYNPAGYAEFGVNTIKSWIIEPQAEYNRVIGSGKLNMLAGSTWQESVNNSSDIVAYGATNDALLQSISAATSITASSTYNQYRYNALFGRIGYNWQDKYILNLTGRRDGSSRFGPGRQFANFGAAGVAWIFTKEAFARDLPAFISFGKLRGSYGSSGNDQIGNYQYLDTWSSSRYPYNSTAGLYPTRLANADYGWEVNRKLEGALELGFLKDRILLTTAYFHNRSGNQLISYTLPTQTGFTGITENFPALVQNTGLELTLNTKNIQSHQLSWTTSFNITFHRNKLVAFPGIATSSYANTYVIGKSLSIVRGFQYRGVNDTTGLFQYTDVNKDGSLNSKDYFNLGSRDPKFYGGFQNSFSYKGWQLDLFFEFRDQWGSNYLHDVYSAPPGLSYNNLPVSLVNHWRQSGDHSAFEKLTQSYSSPAYTAASYFPGSSGAYGDASFIRLKNIALAYNLPAEYIKRAHIQSCRIYLHIQNLLTITHYVGADPEVQNLYSLPPLKTFTAGIQFTL